MNTDLEDVIKDLENEASAIENSNPGTKLSKIAPNKVAKIPNCAAAPKNKVFGFAINAPKSVKAPTPIKIMSGKTPVSIPIW